MDHQLIKYLRSGKAFVLVGSGPSIHMGYPNWKDLAETALNAASGFVAATNSRTQQAQRSFERGDYLGTFQAAEEILTREILCSKLYEKLRPRRNHGRIYELITRWPVATYLTTNYDDAIAKHLRNNNQHFEEFGNTIDDFRNLNTDSKGKIFRIHGDLRRPSQVILTRKDYDSISSSHEWLYWREVIKTLVREVPLIIIGHSLRDPHIAHILTEVQEYSRIDQPVCWLTPSIDDETHIKFLEKYRVRVIPYVDRGQHEGLASYIASLNCFIPPAEQIRIAQRFKPSNDDLAPDPAAQGLLICSSIAETADITERIVRTLMGMIKAVIPKVNTGDWHQLSDLLYLAGWPKNLEVTSTIRERLLESLQSSELIERQGSKLRYTQNAQIESQKQTSRNCAMREAFLSSLRERALKKSISICMDKQEVVVIEIEKCLLRYFQETGLTLAIIISGGPYSAAPTNILEFLNQTSAMFASLEERNVFLQVAIDIFITPRDSERQYLGRLSQGYFAYHILGVHGEAARARIDHLVETLWLLDSNALIQLLAQGAPTNHLFVESIGRLKSNNVSMFTTDRLFSELVDHLGFAQKVVARHGALSHYVQAGAMGEAPYTKPNQFLQGFVAFQALNLGKGWEQYEEHVFGTRYPDKQGIAQLLKAFGINVYKFDEWPGFNSNDFSKRDELTKELSEHVLSSNMEYGLVENKGTPLEQNVDYTDWFRDPQKKVRPEAEAAIIVQNQRQGTYDMLEPTSGCREAWFVSDTSYLNKYIRGMRVTFPTSAFINLAQISFGLSEGASADLAFDTIVEHVAHSGVSVLEPEVLARIGASNPDPGKLTYNDTMNELKRLIGKYANSDLDAIPESDRPLAATQAKEELLATYKLQAENLAKANEAMKRELEKRDRILSSSEFKRFTEREAQRKAQNLKKSRAKKSGQNTQKRKRRD